MAEKSEKYVKLMNEWGAKRLPFFFMIDYSLEKPVVQLISHIDPKIILFQAGLSNQETLKPEFSKEFTFKKYPVSFQEYKKSFDIITPYFLKGATFLVNLTCSTPIETNLSLKEIFYRAQAKYKLWYQDCFTVFSPESFVKIKGNEISTYPMKGTIDAAVPNAAEVIIQDVKELAEHTTIVDLLRNDLNRVAKNVRVVQFRYIEEIKTSSKNLLQVSSHIQGDLEDDWQGKIGSILFSLLPAGSVTGAPKKKTLEIIKEAETHCRGYYTGIFGTFDGFSLDSAVMIRFIEKNKDGQLVFKSGGGITYDSKLEMEYQEMVDKVYVPII